MSRLRRIPRALLLVALITFLHATCWAVLTPVMQVPDEPVHIGYAQYVVENQDLTPTPPTLYWIGSEELSSVFSRVPWSIQLKPSWSEFNDSEMDRAMRQDLDVHSDGNAGYAAPNPPLYPVVMAAPYLVNEAFGGDALDAILLMRLTSALLAALTVAGIWLFLRELLPRTPWAWTAGALAVAFQPIFAFLGGGVNNDNLMMLWGAWLLYLSARTFRVGLSPRTGALLGLPVAAAMLTKVSALGILATLFVALGLAVLAALIARRDVLRSFAGAACAVAVVAIPYAVYWVLSDRNTNAATGGLGGPGAAGGDLFRSQLSYLWQFWLPRLPFMQDQFASYPNYPVWDIYISAFIGRFGWFEYGFSRTFNAIAAALYVPVLALAGAAVWKARAVLRRRWPIALTAIAFFAVWNLMVNIAGFRYRDFHGLNFEQVRYLFPLLGLYGAVIALAVRGAGAKWGPTAAVVIVMLAAGNSLAGLLRTVERYYL